MRRTGVVLQFNGYLLQCFSSINNVINAQLLQKDASMFMRMVLLKFAASDLFKPPQKIYGNGNEKDLDNKKINLL